MPRRYRHSRRLLVLGLPEGILAALALLIITPAVLWIRFESREQWIQTSGVVHDASIESTHYNATDYATRVTVQFGYIVDGHPYESTWRGFWPEAGGPNALPNESLDLLRSPRYPVSVFYNPDNPWQTYLHPQNDWTRTVYAIWMGLGLAAFLFFAIRFYPAMRG